MKESELEEEHIRRRFFRSSGVQLNVFERIGTMILVRRMPRQTTQPFPLGRLGHAGGTSERHMVEEIALMCYNKRNYFTWKDKRYAQ